MRRGAIAHWKCSHLFVVGKGMCQNLDSKSKSLLKGITLVLCLWENLDFSNSGTGRSKSKRFKKKIVFSLFRFQIIQKSPTGLFKQKESSLINARIFQEAHFCTREDFMRKKEADPVSFIINKSFGCVLVNKFSTLLNSI